MPLTVDIIIDFGIPPMMHDDDAYEWTGILGTENLHSE